MTPEQIQKYTERTDALIEKSRQYIDNEIEVDFLDLLDKCLEFHIERNIPADIDRVYFKIIAYAIALHGLKEWFEVSRSIADEAVESDDVETDQLREYFEKRCEEKGIPFVKKDDPL